MKQTTAYFILIATIVMALTYVSDLYEMYVNGKFYEGYGFAIKVLMFDFILLVPVIITLAIKNSDELKVWVVLCLLLQNVVLFLGFEIGAIYGTVIGFALTTYFIAKYKTFELNKVDGQ